MCRYMTRRMSAGLKTLQFFLVQPVLIAVQEGLVNQLVRDEIDFLMNQQGFMCASIIVIRSPHGFE